jgi:hypothetical protein
MGIVKNNLATKGFSGGLGDEFVYRQIRNRTFFAKAPRKRSVITPNMEAAQIRFRQAVYFAKAMLMDPIIRADYATRAKWAGLTNAFQAAITDYLKVLKINSIQTDNYQGNIGDPIYIMVADDFKIQQLTVALQRPDGTVIESGTAARLETGWIYQATRANTIRAGMKVIIRAKDRPGKQITEERIL